MPTQTFTAGNDSFTVTGVDTWTLNFLAGNDTLDVRGGTFTTASMGDGADIAYLRSGDGLIYGDAGADRFELFGDGFEAHGGDDDDVFNIRGGATLRLYGDAGADSFNFAGAVTSIAVRAGAGNDRFNGSGFAVSGNLVGDAGNDLFAGFSNAAALQLRGGAGNDTYHYFAGTGATFVELADQGIDSVRLARGVSFVLPANVENMVVAFGGDAEAAATLAGNAVNNTIVAGGNMDTLFGYGGNDRLYGGAAQDHLYGGAGNDLLDGGAGDDYLYGEDGNDTLFGRAGYDWMEGGAGNDLYYVDGATYGDVAVEAPGAGIDTVRVALTVAGSSYDLPENIEKGVITTAIGMRLLGNTLDNVLVSGAGNDDLVGWAGNDVLRGGGGDDGLYAWEGNDKVYGDAGNDILYGWDGNDLLVGGTGNDEIWGNEGNDVIEGGPGTEYMGGGGGVNSYIYRSTGDSPVAAPDKIISESEFDTLDLSAIDADTTTDGNQAFTIVGAPTGTPGQLWFVYDSSGGGIDVLGDVNGDGQADFAIIVLNWSTLTTDHIVE